MTASQKGSLPKKTLFLLGIAQITSPLHAIWAIFLLLKESRFGQLFHVSKSVKIKSASLGNFFHFWKGVKINLDTDNAPPPIFPKERFFWGKLPLPCSLPGHLGLWHMVTPSLFRWHSQRTTCVQRIYLAKKVQSTYASKILGATYFPEILLAESAFGGCLQGIH